MKRIGAGKISLFITGLVCLFLALCVVFGVWALASGYESGEAALTAAGVAPERERLVYALGIVMFAVLDGYLFWRLVWLGPAYFLYNEEMVTFVLSRRDRRSYRWAELRAAGVEVRNLAEIEPGSVPLMSGWFFRFPDGKRMALRRMSRGCRDMEDLLRRKGLASNWTWRT